LLCLLGPIGWAAMPDWRPLQSKLNLLLTRTACNAQELFAEHDQDAGCSLDDHYNFHGLVLAKITHRNNGVRSHVEAIWPERACVHRHDEGSTKTEQITPPCLASFWFHAEATPLSLSCEPMVLSRAAPLCLQGSQQLSFGAFSQKNMLVLGRAATFGRSINSRVKGVKRANKKRALRLHLSDSNLFKSIPNTLYYKG